MAPETINNKDVDYAVDLWALGCILYQLLAGETPFDGGSAYLTFLRAKDGHLHPPDFFSDDAKDAITKLLQTDGKERLTLSDVKGSVYHILQF